MKLETFDFSYPQALVAQHPLEARSDAKLLVAHRRTKEIHHTSFNCILDLLNPGDCLVFNDTRVIPARLFGNKETGAAIEVVLLRNVEGHVWKCLVKACRPLKVGTKIVFSGSFFATLTEVLADRTFLLELTYDGTLHDHLDKVGHMPLPPYIDRSDEKTDWKRYQTVYAKNEGAVAAPTAGLHWTQTLLDQATQKGIEIATVTLHVGYGTFEPIHVANIYDHTMHEECVEITDEAAAKINSANRVVSVGTTTVRALESSVKKGRVNAGSCWTNLFITPGYNFKVVDALQTNFHQPKSSLLVMVSALAEKNFIMQCYQEAIQREYRLFSYGDTMLIL